jgi:hypothetical protein
MNIFFQLFSLRLDDNRFTGMIFGRNHISWVLSKTFLCSAHAMAKSDQTARVIG